MPKREYHPYGEFIPEGAQAIIIGSFPIGKFTDPERRGEIKASEKDFFFGGERNLLWKILSEVYQVPLTTREEIQDFLIQKKIGIGDVIKSCVRDRGGASDSQLLDIEWNTDLLKIINAHDIHRVYLTSRQVEKWFKRLFPETSGLELITLFSPSGQTARSLVRMPAYQNWLKLKPHGTTFEYLVKSYKEALNNN